MDEQAKYAALHNWFLSPQGQGVAAAFRMQLQDSQATIRGDSLLQLGVCGENGWLKALDFRYKWFVSPSPIPGRGVVYASPHNLPFERSSVDCIVAPFSIEATADKVDLLEEIDRVLSPMGHLIFLGVNPVSLWGLSLWLRRLSCFGGSSVSLRSALWVKHALSLRGYQPSELMSFYYIPPVIQQSWIERLEFLNQMGKMIRPFPTGFYCLIMQKREVDQTRIAPELLKSNFNFARV